MELASTIGAVISAGQAGFSGLGLRSLPDTEEPCFDQLKASLKSTNSEGAAGGIAGRAGTSRVETAGAARVASIAASGQARAEWVEARGGFVARQHPSPSPAAQIMEHFTPGKGRGKTFDAGGSTR